MKQEIKILIINSRKDQLSQSASLLSRSGYQVLIADSRSLGYKIAREKKPDVLIQFIHSVAELPDELMSSEVKTFQGRLLIIDAESLVSGALLSNPDYILRQGSGLAEALPEVVSDLFEYSPIPVPAYLKEARVLVVDDELMNRTYYEELIKSMGLHCDACGDIPTASALIKETDYELVISDVLLGDTIGLVLANVLANCQRKSLFMLVTGMSESEFKDQFGEVSYDALLHKPVSPSHFRNTVLQLLLKSTRIEQVPVAPVLEEKLHYNPERVYKLLKHNKASIDEVMQNFALYLAEAQKVIPTVKGTQDLHLLRKSFHDLGNLCYYFGAEFLFDLIKKYSGTHQEDQKFIMIPSITEELDTVAGLHREGVKMASTLPV